MTKTNSERVRRFTECTGGAWLDTDSGYLFADAQRAHRSAANESKRSGARVHIRWTCRTDAGRFDCTRYGTTV